MKPRLQNKIAGSNFTLPFCAVLATALWWLPQRAFSWRHLLGLVVCLFATYIIMETDVRQHIIRIRTRMMPCVWLIMSACLSFMHPLEEPLIAATLLSISYMQLFYSYQRHRPQLAVFHTFLLLSIGSFFAPVMLLMAIPFYLYLIFFLRSLTKKAFWAGILGLVAPYGCYGIWCFTDPFHTSPSMVRLPLLFPIEWKPDGFLSLPFAWQASAAIVFLLSIISIVHYLHTKYNDKIRARMFLYIYTTQTLLLMAYLLLQPAHYQTALALIIASASPLIAHYFALTSSIFSNIIFVLSLLLMAGVAILNLWMTSFSIS